MKTGWDGRMCKNSTWMFALAALVGLPLVALAVEQIRFKPGWNLFKPQDDIQYGREASADVDKKLPLVNDPEVLRYVNNLGRQLTAVAPVNTDYPWTFKVVNSRDINAFALPGGFIYVNRGAIEAAEDEAQIAGVMAHESGHVVMRHGTHQATMMVLEQAPLAIAGGMLGRSGSLWTELGKMGIGLGMLKNSREAESQADQVGTYILYHAGYDPRAMAQFFEIIEKKYPQQTLEFFSDHPNPEHRIEKVDALIPRLGPAREGKTDSPGFQAAKRRLLAIPPPPKAKPASRGSADTSSPPPPSSRLLVYQGLGFNIGYPDNWTVQAAEDAVTLAPPGGFVEVSQGQSAQAYGASITRYHGSNLGGRGWGLAEATDRVIQSLRQSNPSLRIIQQDRVRAGAGPALLTLLENDSPLEGQKEVDQMLTVRVGDDLLAVVLIAPRNSWDAYQPTFRAILQSLQLTEGV